MKLFLDFIRTTNCLHPWMARIHIQHEIEIGENDEFTLMQYEVNPSDLYDYEYALKYMSYGVYMSYGLYMGGAELQFTSQTAVDISDKISNNDEYVYVAVPESVVNGTSTLLYQLIHFDGSGYESTDFVLGYMPVPVHRLEGPRRLNTLPMRQSYRGKHDSAKYNMQFSGVGQDIRLISTTAIPKLTTDTSALIRIDYKNRLIRM